MVGSRQAGSLRLGRRRTFTRLLGTLSATVLVTACSPDESTPEARIAVAPIQIRGALIPESPAGGRLAVYAEIENRGVDDALVELTSPIAEDGSVHLMEMSDGMMTMKPTPALDIPAGRTVTLETGAAHGMLEGLVRVPAAGEVVEVTFIFASGTEVLVPVPVVPLSELVGND